MYVIYRWRSLLVLFLVIACGLPNLSAVQLTITNKSGVMCRVQVNYLKSSEGSKTLVSGKSAAWDSLPEGFEVKVWKCVLSPSCNTGRLHVEPFITLKHPPVEKVFRDTTIDINYVIRLEDDSILKLVSGEE